MSDRSISIAKFLSSCQGRSCSDYETIVYNQPYGTFMPLLKDVFVPLELSDLFIKDSAGDEYPGHPGFNERGEKQPKLELFGICYHKLPKYLLFVV
ncbi:MAG: hypothetical protein RLZZ74_2253 [Cyanobacteriota bacterium]